MRLDLIRFRNFRCFEERTFEFAARFNLLIGDNATGKTSILHGISIAVGAMFLGFPEPAEPAYLDVDLARIQTFWNHEKPNLQPQYPVIINSVGELDGQQIAWERKVARAGGRTSRVFTGHLKLLAEKLAERVATNAPVVLPVLGFYGTGRVWKQRKSTKYKTVSPASRFDGYLHCLDPASDDKRLLEWFKTRELVALQKKRPLDDLEAVRAAICSCIPGTDAVYWDLEADQLAIRQSQKVLWFRQLSDGYRNMLGMVADIAERCVILNPQLGAHAVTETPGIVLIDEIDLHLHPKWQRHVVDDLLRTFPKLQFMSTTHSPFIIQSLAPVEGIQLLNLDNPESQDFADKSIEDIAEQIQMAGEQTRSERYQAMMVAAEEYYRVLEQTDNASVPQLQVLKDRLDELSSRFSDDPAYHAILKVEREARLGHNGVS